MVCLGGGVVGFKQLHDIAARGISPSENGSYKSANFHFGKGRDKWEKCQKEHGFQNSESRSAVAEGAELIFAHCAPTTNPIKKVQ